jgi:hypothetical protein
VRPILRTVVRFDEHVAVGAGGDQRAAGGLRRFERDARGDHDANRAVGNTARQAIEWTRTGNIWLSIGASAGGINVIREMLARDLRTA